MGFHENEMNRRQGIVKPYKSQFDRTFNEQLLDAVNDNISKRNFYFVLRSPNLTEGLLNVVYGY
ncbi:hypothetical protein AwWohl_11910 [Gammaproteobacteria bacterium]|nr:hypothetical protein AwWohl_11910 [Gammaproteobacteria bacterium]